MNTDLIKEYVTRAEPWLYRLAMAALLVGAAYLAYQRWAPETKVTHISGQPVVVFDVVKLANAQRKVAAAFLGKDPAQQGDGSLLIDVQSRTRDVIRAVAGRGTLVLIKQAVIHTDIPDITDEVLRELKLPLDVPTQDAAASVLDMAPTQWSVQSLPPPHKPTQLPPTVAAETSKELLP